jgi:YVTN family beta-propeller protein
VKVFRTDGDFTQVAIIPVGDMPHGVWPSGDGSRVYVGLENADALAVIDTDTNKTIGTPIVIGQAPQAIAFVPDAVPQGAGTQNLQQLGLAGQATHFTLSGKAGGAPTSVALFDQGLVQVLQAAVTGLQPGKLYVIGLSDKADGSGAIQALAAFSTNPAGSAVVDVTGPIRQLVLDTRAERRHYLVVAPQVDGRPGLAAQVQTTAN